MAQSPLWNIKPFKPAPFCRCRCSLVRDQNQALVLNNVELVSRLVLTLRVASHLPPLDKLSIASVVLQQRAIDLLAAINDPISWSLVRGLLASTCYHPPERRSLVALLAPLLQGPAPEGRLQLIVIALQVAEHQTSTMLTISTLV
jgi:hypothetical protein